MPSLAEAQSTLRQMRQQSSSSELDIAARTELSHARQILAKVQDVLIGQGEIERIKTFIDQVDGKINDLLQYIDTSLNDVRNVSFKENEK